MPCTGDVHGLFYATRLQGVLYLILTALLWSKFYHCLPFTGKAPEARKRGPGQQLAEQVRTLTGPFLAAMCGFSSAHPHNRPLLPKIWAGPSLVSG